MITSSHSNNGRFSRRLHGSFSSLWRWFDSDYFPDGAEAELKKPDNVDWRRCMSFVVLHLGCLGVIWVGWSWPALAVAAALYFLRMFMVTAFYHRYFAHRTFRTSRAAQFAFAILGGMSAQRGALWWAAVHRQHHQHADHEDDVHSPGLSGFWWAHIGWMTSARNFPTNYERIKDLARFPELVLLNRFDLLVPLCFAFCTYGLGAVIARWWPAWGASGAQMLVWGFFISTVVLLHATLCINSLAHTFGGRRYATDDDSRNSLLLALITLGEGWHNNHHHYMSAARQGFYWWEIDMTYYGLKALSWTGLIWDLRGVPKNVFEKNHSGAGADAANL